jgi:hypothetical protein
MIYSSAYSAMKRLQIKTTPRRLVAIIQVRRVE